MYHFPRSSNKQLLLWQISSGKDRYGLFVDLREKLNSLTCRLRHKLSICITVYDITKLQIVCSTKTEGLLLSNSQFLMNSTQQRLQGLTIEKTKTKNKNKNTGINQNYTGPDRIKAIIWNWAIVSSNDLNKNRYITWD